MQFFDGLGVITKIHLAADKDDWKALAEVKDFGDPLEKKKTKGQLPSLDHPSIIAPTVCFVSVCSNRNSPSLERCRASLASLPRNR